MKRILSFLGLILSLSLLLSACGQTTDTDGLPNIVTPVLRIALNTELKGH